LLPWQTLAKKSQNLSGLTDGNSGLWATHFGFRAACRTLIHFRLG